MDRTNHSASDQARFNGKVDELADPWQILNTDLYFALLTSGRFYEMYTKSRLCPMDDGYDAGCVGDWVAA